MIARMVDYRCIMSGARMLAETPMAYTQDLSRIEIIGFLIFKRRIHKRVIAHHTSGRRQFDKRRSSTVFVVFPPRQIAYQALFETRLAHTFVTVILYRLSATNAYPTPMQPLYKCIARTAANAQSSTKVANAIICKT